MIKKITLVISILSLFICCSTEDFEVPSGIREALPEGTILPLENLRRPVAGKFPQEIITFNIADQFVEGYVISNDAAGNFFKELFIQDQPSDPTTGIQVLIDERALHQRFPFGSKVRIRLEGLSISEQRGVVKLGVLSDNEIVAIPFTAIDNTIFRTPEMAEIIPKKIAINEITNELESVLVSFSNMQFDRKVIQPNRKTFAGEKEDRFDSFRPLFNCDNQSYLTLCTSTFSNFSQLSLPIGSGIISGVLTKDFDGFNYVLKINEPTDIQFTNTNRCDPNFYDCQITTNRENKTLLFFEDFNDITNPSQLENRDWFNINTTGDEIKWGDRKVPNIDNRVLDISARNSGLRPLEAWLVTPKISLTTIEEIAFSTRLRTDNNNGKALNIWITNDWNGNPSTTAWQLLDLEIPTNNSNYVTLIQRIQGNCIAGDIRIGFQYLGYDPVVTSIYEIDEVQFYKLNSSSSP